MSAQLLDFMTFREKSVKDVNKRFIINIQAVAIIRERVALVGGAVYKPARALPLGPIQRHHERLHRRSDVSTIYT